MLLRGDDASDCFAGTSTLPAVLLVPDVLFDSRDFILFPSFVASFITGNVAIDLKLGFAIEFAIFGGGWVSLLPYRSSRPTSLFGEREEVRGNLLVPCCGAWEVDGRSAIAV